MNFKHMFRMLQVLTGPDKMATMCRHTLQDECRILLLHGLLHLLGHDHERGEEHEESMAKQEQHLMHSLGWKVSCCYLALLHRSSTCACCECFQCQVKSESMLPSVHAVEGSLKEVGQQILTISVAGAAVQSPSVLCEPAWKRRQNKHASAGQRLDWQCPNKAR